MLQSSPGESQRSQSGVFPGRIPTNTVRHSDVSVSQRGASPTRPLGLSGVSQARGRQWLSGVSAGSRTRSREDAVCARTLFTHGFRRAVVPLCSRSRLGTIPIRWRLGPARRLCSGSAARKSTVLRTSTFLRWLAHASSHSDANSRREVFFQGKPPIVNSPTRDENRGAPRFPIVRLPARV